ncbi:MAG: DUF348 domain-containing protein [Firmicutes bacterium]|nr:DUF348 domain-containing protein [Bacillota bacterium]
MEYFGNGNINKYFFIKVAMIILFTVIVTMLGGMEALTLPLREVVINDNGSIITLKTKKLTVGDALEQNGINIRCEDYIYPSPEEKLLTEKTNTVFIKRAIPICVNVDGAKLEILTHNTTLREVLEENQIEVNESDRIEGAGIDQPVFPGMNVKIVRIKEDLIIEKEPISYIVERRPNQRLDQGVEKTVREGKEGIRELLYRVVYEDGVLKTKELVKETIASAPVNKLVEYGTIAKYTTARGETFRYSKVLDMRATAYTSSYKDTGKNPDHPHFGITYTGIKAKRGIIAVDPKVIPLGSRVYVEGVGKTPDYGFALAADIGGAIKGNLIDLYFETQEEADGWGIKKVRVYILSE